jgi:hypothetical protein
MKLSWATSQVRWLNGGGEKKKSFKDHFPKDKDRDGLQNIGFSPFNHLTWLTARGLHYTWFVAYPHAFLKYKTVYIHKCRLV